jgi:hypothetical protein
MENTFFQHQDYFLAEQEALMADKKKESEKKPSEKKQCDKNEVNEN